MFHYLMWKASRIWLQPDRNNMILLSNLISKILLSKMASSTINQSTQRISIKSVQFEKSQRWRQSHQLIIVVSFILV